MALQKLAENRRLRRHKVRLKVFERESGELLGYAENLHIRGMKLVGKITPPTNTEIKIWLEMDDEEEKIPLTIFRVWSSFFDTVPVFYCTGLHFVNPSDEIMDKIQTYIDKLDDSAEGTKLEDLQMNELE